MTPVVRPLLCMAFGALIAAATMQLTTPHAPPPTHQDSGDLLLVPDGHDAGTICLPVMNRMHWGPCPQVLI